MAEDNTLLGNFNSFLLNLTGPGKKKKYGPDGKAIEDTPAPAKKETDYASQAMKKVKSRAQMTKDALDYE